jgi:transmembrane sensor
MSTSDDPTTLTIREAAAEWIVRLNGGDGSGVEQGEFIAWLRRSPEHVREYLRAEKAWLDMGGAALADSTPVSELLREGNANVVPLGRPRVPRHAPEAEKVPSSRSRRTAVAGVAAAVLVIAAGLAVWLGSRLGTELYATGVGEQRQIVLADGSAVELNTHSRVRVRMTDSSRDLQLLDGEAFFTVAHDTARPFRVMSGSVVVRALGTQFNVYREADRTHVTVIEGRVSVTNDERGGEVKPLELRAGDAAEAAGNAALEAIPGNAAKATAWRERRLVFENTTLADAIAQFNRYNAQQLVIEDPVLAGQRIDGVFNADKPQALMNFLTRRGDVEVVPRAGSQQVLLAPAARSAR